MRQAEQRAGTGEQRTVHAKHGRVTVEERRGTGGQPVVTARPDHGMAWIVDHSPARSGRSGPNKMHQREQRFRVEHPRSDMLLNAQPR